MFPSQVSTVKLVLLLSFAKFGIFHLYSWCDFGTWNDSSEVPGCCAGVSPCGSTLKSALFGLFGWVFLFVFFKSSIVPNWVITAELWGSSQLLVWLLHGSPEALFSTSVPVDSGSLRIKICWGKFSVSKERIEIKELNKPSPPPLKKHPTHPKWVLSQNVQTSFLWNMLAPWKSKKNLLKWGW